MDDITSQYYSSHVKESAELYNSCRGKGISKYFPVAFIRNSTALDIGSGTGRDLALLNSEGYDTYGIDASLEMVRHSIEQNQFLEGKVRTASNLDCTPETGMTKTTSFRRMLL